MVDSFDVIIVGAGHNGLVCASVLARAGLKVGVFERRELVGGAATTEEVWPGFKVSRASYVPNMFEEVVADLQLPNFGLKLMPLDPRFFTPFPDKRWMLTFQSAETTAKEIEKFSKKDAAAFLKLKDFSEKFVQLISPMMLSPPIPLDLVLSALKGEELEQVVRSFLMMSCKDLLNENFESEEVKAALCMLGAWDTSMGIDAVGTSYILALSLGKQGYGYAIGGAGAVSDALFKCAISHGAKIFTNNEVKQILVGDGKAKGVQLSSGTNFFSKIVVSNADPKRTFLRLVLPEYLEQGFLDKVKHLRTQGTSFKINLAINKEMRFRCFEGERGSFKSENFLANKSFVNIAPSMEYVERASDECKWGRLPKEPPLGIFCQTALDDTVAPPGMHTLSIIAKYYPYQVRNGEWDNLREKALNNAIGVLESYVEGLRSSIIHVEALSPVDLERLYYLTEGNVTHLDQTLNQMLNFRPIIGWANYRTPLEGLYLCGAGTHPGGGVTGGPGFNAAHEILEAWKTHRK